MQVILSALLPLDVFLRVLVLLAVTTSTRAVAGEPPWYYTDRAYQDLAGRRPLTQERSKALFNKVLLCCGWTDATNEQQVLWIDSDRSEPLATHIIVRTDTLPVVELARCATFPPEEGKRSYLAVVLGEVVPDSLRVVLANGSMVVVPYQLRSKK
jgi:hypothetical protein